NRKDYAYAVYLPGPPSGGLRAPRIGFNEYLGGPGRRVLATIPVDLTVQYRSARVTPLNGFLEGGLGLMTTNAKLSIGLSSRTAMQQVPEGLLGAGATLRMGRSLEAVAGVTLHQAWASGGKVWTGDDAPRFVTY